METTPAKKRQAWPMLLLHLVAWGVVLAVGVSFIDANRIEKWVFTFGGHPTLSRNFNYSYYGWPLYCLENKDRNALFNSSDTILLSIPLIFNVLMGLLVVGGTFFVFVLPFWRQQKLFQIKLKSFFILTATVAVLLAGYRATYSFEPDLFFNRPHTSFTWDMIYYRPHSLQILLGLGIGCTIYMGIWLVLRLVSVLVRILVKRRPAAQSE